MAQLSIDSTITKEELKAFEKKLIENKTTELSLKKVRLGLYADEQFQALVELIDKSKVTTLIFEDNELGTEISLTRWQTLCKSLIGSEVKILKIDNNKLEHFSCQHWQALKSLIDGHCFNLLTLQQNNLSALDKNNHKALKELVLSANYPCHLADNNWHKNLTHWNDLTARETPSVTGTSHSFLAHRRDPSPAENRPSLEQLSL